MNTDHDFDGHGGHAPDCRMCRIEQADRERDEARAALADVSAWLPNLKPAGHSGDEESGQHDDDCQMCQYEAIESRIDAILAPAAPTEDA